MKDIAIVIVSWNVHDKLKACLDSVCKAQRALDVEVFVVDNASRDGSVDMVERDFPQVKLIRNTYNAGCARAVNAAIKRASSRYILWLNPDMVLFDDTLEALMRVANEHPRAGVIGARLQDANGTIIPHVRRFPTALDQLAIISKFAKLFPQSLDRYLCRDFNYDIPAYVDSVRGSFFCMPRATLEKIGLLDERFFVWFEEVDFCKRAVSANFPVVYDPRVRAVDLVGQSFKQVPVIKKQAMFISSLLKYFGKHGIWHA